MSDEPLIHTSKGNLPVASLTRVEGWDFDPSGITYWEEYRQGDEVIRRSAARYQLPPGQTLGIVQGEVG